MLRLPHKVRVRTGRNGAGRNIREVIAGVNPLLRGWANYLRVWSTVTKFGQLDDHVGWRIPPPDDQEAGMQPPRGRVKQRNENWFNGSGWHRLHGTGGDRAAKIIDKRMRESSRTDRKGDGEAGPFDHRAPDYP